MTDLARRLLSVATPVLALALLAAGCGVPSSGPPVVVATPPPPGVAEDQPNDPTQQRPEPPPGETPQVTVARYFHAAAADEPRTAESQVRSFLAPAAQSAWHPTDAPIPVVRITGLTVTTSATQVTVTGDIVGELTAAGAVEPRHDAFDQPEPFQWTFHLVSRDTPAGKIWQITNPPDGMWLSTDAMRERYYLWPVYFVRQRQTLVPDLRYVPRMLTKDKSRTRLVNWLLEGPSSWLRGRVESEIPPGTKLRGLVVVEGNRVVVDLTSEADGVDRLGFNVLSAQLAWTLRPVMPGTLEVRVEGRRRTIQPRDKYDNLNATNNLNTDRRYVVAAGKVQRFAPGRNATATPATRLLSTPENSAVVFGGIADGETTVALIRRDRPRNGRHTMSLWLGQLTGSSPPRYIRISDLSGRTAFSRPSWSGSAWYVAVDGEIYQITRQNPAPQKVNLRSDRKVTALSVAPDGARIALVIDNQAFVAPLTGGSSPSVGPLRRVGRAVAAVTDIAWSGEDRVVVAGHSNRTDGVAGDLWEVSIDDVLARPLASGHVREAPTYIAVKPTIGWFNEASSPPSVLYGVKGIVYEAFSLRVDQVGTGHAPFYSS